MARSKLQSFFNSTATLMTEQLQGLAINTITDYKKIIQTASQHDSAVSTNKWDQRAVNFRAL